MHQSVQSLLSGDNEGDEYQSKVKQSNAFFQDIQSRITPVYKQDNVVRPEDCQQV